MADRPPRNTGDGSTVVGRPDYAIRPSVRRDPAGYRARSASGSGSHRRPETPQRHPGVLLVGDPFKSAAAA